MIFLNYNITGKQQKTLFVLEEEQINSLGVLTAKKLFILTLFCKTIQIQASDAFSIYMYSHLNIKGNYFSVLEI